MTRGNKRFDARRDKNEPDIVDALRAAGFLVARDLPIDLLVIRDGKIHLLEVKTPEGKLRGKQIDFIADCEAQGVTVHVVWNIEDALWSTGRLANEDEERR